MRTILTIVQTILAPSDEGAVDCKLTERQFTFYKSTEGGKNYKLDELIGYYLINLHNIIIPTNPNLSISPLPTDKIEKTKFVVRIFLYMQTKLKYQNHIIKYFFAKQNPLVNRKWLTNGLFMELIIGLEPMTSSLPWKCSTY